MAYADFKALDDYRSKHAGSAIAVVLIDDVDPSQTVIGATTGISTSEDFETLPVEEAGDDGVNEIAQGRHSGTGSLPAFWTPEWNDSILTRQNFIGRKFTIIERIALDRPGAGTVINAFVGVVISRVGNQMGARGLKTIDMAFNYTRKFNGQEWAELTGQA